MDDRPGLRLTDEQKKRQRARNLAIGIAVALLVVIFYAITVLKLGPAVLKREL
jgi:hypothetical protein